ncbi:MAG: GtrA family protein [Chitinophagaceae bacterium]|nr:GtrA family protein [Chitinophagaceae bacterium]
MESVRTFTKAQAASLVASCVDFLVTWLLVRQLGAPPVPGSVTGTICGGVTHFLISRNWAFSAQEKKWTGQLTRYALVWIGNLILNASGVWLLYHIAGWNVWPAKIVTAIGIAVFYNYVLQKRYVFK